MADKKEEIQYESLIVQGAKYETTLTNKFRNRKVWQPHNPNLIVSFIPGTIIDVMVKTGQKVKAGETILVLEAMKMHNNVLMPFDGEIVKINVKNDEIVPKNHVMIEIKPIQGRIK
ncbi:biotin-requiring enzyme [Bacteroidales bacterium 6E]|nr:biotin-requiring enzyme [Bacteroidales bacterium 6E]